MDILVDFSDGNFGIFQQLFLLLVQGERTGGDVFLRFPSSLKVLAEIFYMLLIEAYPLVKIDDAVSWLDRLVQEDGDF